MLRSLSCKARQLWDGVANQEAKPRHATYMFLAMVVVYAVYYSLPIYVSYTIVGAGLKVLLFLSAAYLAMHQVGFDHKSLNKFYDFMYLLTSDQTYVNGRPNNVREIGSFEKR